MDVQKAIQTKQAVRLFTDQPVPEDVIRAILEAGRRSQSSKNQQPWRFVVIRERGTLEALSKLGKFAGHLAGANFAVCLVSNGAGNWPSYDLGQASAYMQLAGWELGVGSCIAAIYEPDAAKELLGIPAELDFWCAISFGYPSPQHEPAKLGGRKPLDELVHWEKW
jgi:nitroreductase